MPLPIQSYNTITTLRNAINTYLVPNGSGDINATEINNVLNSVVDFLAASSVNGGLAKIEQSGGAIVLSNGVTIVKTTIPTSLTWIDNIYNQWVIINQLSSSIPLLSGLSYVDIFGTVQTSIPANTTVNLYKVSNGQWVNSNV